MAVQLRSELVLALFFSEKISKLVKSVQAERVAWEHAIIHNQLRRAVCGSQKRNSTSRLVHVATRST